MVAYQLWPMLLLIPLVAGLISGVLLVLRRLVFVYPRQAAILHWLIVFSRWISLGTILTGIAILGWIFIPAPQVVSPSGPLTSPAVFGPDNPLTIRFDRPVARVIKPVITPPTPGTWVYQTGAYGLMFYDRLVFTPTAPLQPGTEYTVSLEKILPLTWLTVTQANKYLFVFSTLSEEMIPYQTASSLNVLNVAAPISPESTPSAEPAPKDESFNLKVPLYKQHYKFTCYSAASQMVLAFRNIMTVTELGFLKEIGYDPTPKNQLTNTWGDPSQGIVGTFNGAGEGGYGVHWDPVAKALSAYRDVKVMREWSVEALLQEVKAGNPVMVWWVNGVWPAKNLTWNSAHGDKIQAVNGMHVEIVTGWIGSLSKPEYILTNDPWRGYRKYSPATFNNLWKWFNNTAIVVY